MNIQNVLLLVATLLMPAVSFAVCPVKHSTVFYINGIGVLEDDAKNSAIRLKQVLSSDPRATPDCVTVKSAYNYSATAASPYAIGLALDLVEALIQKASETGKSAADITLSLLRLSDAQWIQDILQGVTVLASGPTFLLDSQIAEHTAAYEAEAQTSDAIVLTGHSQGNYYANQEWNGLSATSKPRVHLVAVATPAVSQADGGPYVTVDRDFFANVVFAPLGAPGFNVHNDEPCAGDVLDWWFCHGWKESYLNGTNSKQKIIDDIVGGLSTTPVSTTQTQFSGTITNSTLFLTGFVPDSDSWVFTRGNYDTPDYQTWVDSLCLSSSDTLNLAWLTTVYSFSTGPDQDFTVTGVNLNDVLPSGPDECGSPGTFYLAVYDFNGSWRQRIFKGVLILHRIDATHWVGEAG